MIARHPAWRTGLVLLAVVVAPVAAALASGAAVIQACVPASGAWSQVALRLALLHPDAACPEGTLGAGAAPEQALTVVAAVALPALLGHLALLTGAAGLVGSARRVMAAEVRRFVRVLLPAAAPPVPDDGGDVVLPVQPARPVRLLLARRPLRRGPPAWVGA
ncbi:hypothetical protein ATJ97_1686 [Georgenia soli]|uniref:Uncharacterized protein n=1 Tax=Georgenia soli TaxID=638953 RepID=A0A2A9ELS9_9MICO|nr:hypothetical protein [Georgenia soli]PFG39190.1 hypothetical protein ATJ97_1686 [Georgenia soli]